MSPRRPISSASTPPAVARGEKLPVTFTVGAHPLDFFAATTRQPGDELALVASFRAEPAPVVKSLTNDILVPADAEMTLEGYLDERGYVEPEGPFGEYMGYYGAIHMDPVFHCTAITMRRDVLHHTLLHGSAFVLDQTDSANISAMRTEAEAMRILKAAVREPVAVYLRCGFRRRQHAAGLDQAAQLWRGAFRDRTRCSAASCGSSTSMCSTRTSTSTTTARWIGRSARASRPTRTWSSCKACSA